jgi:SAM-dependent methyltransferase
VNSTLEYFSKKQNIDLSQSSPIIIRYSRYNIPELFKELNFTSGAEIGTEHGRYAERLCNVIPNLKLYCIDPYLVYPYYDGQKEQKEVNKFYEEAERRLAPFNHEILKMTSMEAVKNFEPNSLDFVFVDGNHFFEYVVNDIIHWSRIVKPGGIIYGHDYSLTDFHVKQAVDAFMDASKINPWFIMRSRSSRIIDCWMYIRQEEDWINYSVNVAESRK